MLHRVPIFRAIFGNGKALPYGSQRKRLRIGCIIVGVGLIAGSLLAVAYFQPFAYGHDISIRQLTEAGYYAYVFPGSYESQLGLRRNVWMLSFDAHCTQGNGQTWNPVHVGYRDAKGNGLLNITVSPQDALWNPEWATQSIALDASWIPSREGIYYSPSQNETIIKAKDMFGMDVSIGANLQVSELGRLIDRLIYVGPDPSSVSDPWENACKGSNMR
jgi:hypothetical protein